MPHGIMKIPNLSHNILSCLLGDLFRDLDIHIAIDEVIGVDFGVGVHFGIRRMLDHALLIRGMD